MLKNTLKIAGCLGIIIAILCILILIIYFLPYPKSDYCLEDGDCKEGRIIYVDEQEILINEENCLKNNWIWYKKGKYCKIDTNNTRFSVKEIVYD